MRIAVTGGSGGIGRAVVEQALARGDSVVSIDRVASDDLPAGAEEVVADTGDYDALVESLAGCDALVHMAAFPSPLGRPDHVVHDANVLGSYHAMRAAVENGITRVCQASSVNATGMSFSRRVRLDYLPLDEEHPTYVEDPYGLSKWVAEAQADALVRRHAGLRVASLRFHWVVPDRGVAAAAYDNTGPDAVKNLWGYTTLSAAVRATLLAVEDRVDGHEVFYVTAPDSVGPLPSRELARRFYPGAELRGDLDGHAGFFSCAKAGRLLGWQHDEPGTRPDA